MTDFAGGVLHSLSSLVSSPSLTSVLSGEGTLLFTVVEVAVAIIIIAIFGTLLARGVARISQRAGASKGVANSVRQWIAVLMILLGVAAVLGITGISSQLMTIALSGIGGLAVSLALQNTFSNFIAGVLMFHDGVLRLGDEIEFGAIRGEVVKLSLKTTWIRKNDGVISVIGNSNLAAGPIINRTAKERLEKKLEF
ncbi:MAG: mechanosensitive ion channel domain-containing protein [Nitrososphaerales archaeon]